MLTTLALVEDDDDLRDEMCFRLDLAGYRVRACRDGVELDRALQDERCRVVVLDIGLPGEDGLAITERLRRDRPGVGVVMLTARGRLDDRVEGLAVGADAYLVKPAAFSELQAVIESVLRRLRRSEDEGVVKAPWLLRYSALELVTPAGTVVSLTGTEVRLLRALARAGGEAVARRTLVEALGEDFWQFDPRRLDTAMSRLRTKVEEACSDARSAIKAVRGVGYVLSIPMKEAGNDSAVPSHDHHQAL